MSLPEEKAEKALMALVTGALHPYEKQMEVSEEEVIAFLEQGFDLSEEDEEAFGRLGALRLKPGSDHREEPDLVHAEQSLNFAMHREAEEEMDEETRKEIEKKRREVLERLRKRRGKME